MQIQYKGEIKSGVLILRFEGDLMGTFNAGGLMTEVALAAEQKIRTCVLDLSQLRYINSSGIGVLITILTKFRNRGGEVYLMNPSESVKKLLVITKLTAIFQTVLSEEDARAKNVK